ncbi:hypothetical protein AAG906_016092 [Vitis piasezkii]
MEDSISRGLWSTLSLLMLRERNQLENRHQQMWALLPLLVRDLLSIISRFHSFLGLTFLIHFIGISHESLLNRMIKLTHLPHQYSHGPRHKTDRCTTLRHVIQDLIDQGLVHLGQPSVTTNPLPVPTSHAIPPPPDDIHFMNFIEPDDHIHIMSRDDSKLEPIIVGRRQHGPGEFIVTVDHDTSFNLGFVPIEPDYRYMAFGTSTSVLVTPLSPDYGVVPHYEYSNKMLVPKTVFQLDMFRVLAIEMVEDVQLVHAPRLLTDVTHDDDVFKGVISPIMVYDIEDEYMQHDSNEDSSSTSNSSPTDEKVSPTTRNTKIVDFGIVGQPRELRIGSALSTYERWLSNVVLIPKNDDKVRVCVDFRDLNKDSTKDDFLFPHINMLVDNTVGFGYNTILMALEDMEKTSFITEWGTYYYRVMLFGLKNVGATYQRASTTLFHDMMHQDVKVYVDDMLVKSQVTYGKLLGYMVSERGIETDPDKIKVILDMPMSRTEREIKGFLGRLQYISRFICQCTFEMIKEYSMSPLVLVPHTPASGCMLAQLDDVGNERAIYYLSKKMLDYEMRYVMIERLLDWSTYELFVYQTKHYCRSLGLITGFDGRAIDDDFLDEDIAIVTSLLGRRMYFDGMANHSGYKIGQNQFANVLATLTSMIDIPVDTVVRHLLIESRSVPTYCCLIDETELDDDLPWYQDIYQFLIFCTYPELATRFVICKETLYRRSADGMLLFFLDCASTNRVMREVHVGVCGQHIEGHKLAHKIMRTGVSLYSLVYGMETVLPIEIEIGSLRVALEQQISKANRSCSCLSEENGSCIQKRVKPRPLQRDDLVLKDIDD